MGHDRRHRGSRAHGATFDPDAGLLERPRPHRSWGDAYSDVGHPFEENRFEDEQGSVRFARGDVAAVERVGLLRDLVECHDRVTPPLKHIRMPGIEDDDLLRPGPDRKKSRKRP